jgi:hypothetical protein
VEQLLEHMRFGEVEPHSRAAGTVRSDLHRL